MSSRSSRVNDRCGLAVKRDKRIRQTVVRGLAVNTAKIAVRSLVLAVYDKRSFAVSNSRSRSRQRDKQSRHHNGRSRLRAVNVCGLAVKRDKQSFAVSPTRQTVAVNIRSRSHGQRIRLAESDKRSFVVSRKSRHKTRKYLIIL